MKSRSAGRVWPWVALACVSSLASPVRAEIPEYLLDQRVVAIRVQGDVVDGGPQAIGIRIGQSLSRQLVRDAIFRLLSKGRWVDVQVNAEPVAAGVALVFHLQPRIVLRRIEIRGTDALDDQVARDALGLGDGSSIEADALESYTAAIRKAYAERGYLGTRVDVLLRDTDDAAEKVLIVDVDEGEATRIAELEFTGQVPPDPAAIFSSMGVAVGDVLDRRESQDRIQRAERRLRSSGYLEAKLESPVVTVQAARARVAFPAHVGPRYAIEVRGASPLSAREVVDSLAIFDQPLNDTTFDALPTRVRDFFSRHGFLDAKASVERRTLVPGRRATLTLRIQPGPQVEVLGVPCLGA